MFIDFSIRYFNSQRMSLIDWVYRRFSWYVAWVLAFLREACVCYAGTPLGNDPSPRQVNTTTPPTHLWMAVSQGRSMHHVRAIIKIALVWWAIFFWWIFQDIERRRGLCAPGMSFRAGITRKSVFSVGIPWPQDPWWLVCNRRTVCWACIGLLVAKGFLWRQVCPEVLQLKNIDIIPVWHCHLK